MSNNHPHMRGDEILLVAEIEAATALRKAFESLDTYLERFPGAPINRDEFIRRVGLRATNQDDAA
ncbi:hypothetical protein [Thalassospira sp. B30-1]|jgi:trehalose-6-phosphatase|uniref:hypothetical protein n=1 Tax=Thalassospira sp. B30-1 TaxID=2785911 RepID=UPI0018CA318D|nr:hypothetical protein [Thalassospira sp. B30-1]QPL37223.1 hypothetical protein IT971_08040 [Thalassospira sp. B30-1]